MVGFLFLLWQYLWFWDLLPLDWVGIDSIFIAVVFVFVIWLLFSTIMALPFLLFYFLRFSIYLLPFIWVLTEYLRSWLYSILVLGPSSEIGDYFSYGFLGYSSHTSPLLLSLTPLLGVYGLSFIIALANLVLFLLITKWLISTKKYRYLLFSVIFIILILVEIIPFHFVSEKDIESSTVNVVAIQGNNPVVLGYSSEYFMDIAGIYLASLGVALSEYPNTDIIVLPESSQFLRTISLVSGNDIKSLAGEILGSDRYRIIIYGDYDYERNLSIVSAVSNKPDEPPVIIEKSLLMPLGEYQPYLLSFGAKIIGLGGWMDNLLNYRHTDSLFTKHSVINSGIGRISPVSCSEILSFDIYKDINKADSDIIIHQQRLAPFHGSTRVFEHILAVSQIRAAQLRKPIIGSIDGSGYSYIISPQGEVTHIGNSESNFIYGSIDIQYKNILAF
jgi:apolipoprotein N-acyltransferase